MTDFEHMHRLPVLTGSKKQIIWGRNIRKDGFEQMDEWLRDMEEGLHGEENELLSYAKDFTEKFFHREMKAAVYIEIEQYGFSRMLRKTIGKQYKKEHP